MDFGSLWEPNFHVFLNLLHHIFEHYFYADFSLILDRLLDKHTLGEMHSTQ